MEREESNEGKGKERMMRKVQAREEEARRIPPPPSTLTGSMSMAVEGNRDRKGPTTPRSRATSAGSKCSRCQSCNSQCPCALASKQLGSLQQAVAEEHVAHQQTRAQLTQAAREIEILRMLVEQRSATASSRASSVSARSRASSNISAAKSSGAPSSSSSSIPSMASSVRTCSTAEIYRLLDEYNEEARRNGDQLLKLPYWPEAGKNGSKNDVNCDLRIKRNGVTPSTCSSPFTVTSAGDDNCH